MAALPQPPAQRHSFAPLPGAEALRVDHASAEPWSLSARVKEPCTPAAGIDIETEEDAQLGQQIDATLQQGFRWLRFPSALENRFIHSYVQDWRRHETLSALFALFIYDSFLLTDAKILSDIFPLCVKVRLGVVSPIIAFGAWMHWRGLPARIRQTYMALTCISCTTSLIYFQAHTHSPLATYYLFGVLPIIVYTNVVQRIPFWSAFAASMATTIVTIIGGHHISTIPSAALDTFIQLCAATVILTMVASYRLEHDLRDRFLLRMRDELLRRREQKLIDELGIANQQLRQLSETDGLTGVANRRSFEQFLNRSLAQAREQHLPISLVMVDIDFYKLYNDHYGHLEGDRCLRDVARAIQSALRTSNPCSCGDFVARYGGEEFAVILPATAIDEAIEIANRIRLAVTSRALPHANSPVAPCVTISAGIATMQGIDQQLSTELLIRRADTMLYQAKVAGRNRVWPSEMTPA